MGSEEVAEELQNTERVKRGNKVQKANLRRGKVKARVTAQKQREFRKANGMAQRQKKASKIRMLKRVPKTMPYQRFYSNWQTLRTRPRRYGLGIGGLVLVTSRRLAEHSWRHTKIVS